MRIKTAFILLFAMAFSLPAHADFAAAPADAPPAASTAPATEAGTETTVSASTTVIRTNGSPSDINGFDSPVLGAVTATVQDQTVAGDPVTEQSTTAAAPTDNTLFVSADAPAVSPITDAMRNTALTTLGNMQTKLNTIKADLTAPPGGKDAKTLLLEAAKAADPKVDADGLAEYETHLTKARADINGDIATLARIEGLLKNAKTMEEWTTATSQMTTHVGLMNNKYFVNSGVGETTLAGLRTKLAARGNIIRLKKLFGR